MRNPGRKTDYRAGSSIQMTYLLQALNQVENFLLHPLGFFYLRSPSDDGVSKRLHVWLPDGAANPENDRHSHSFNLSSTVAAGRLLNELYRFEVDAAGIETEYEVSYSKNISQIQPTGRRGDLLVEARFETLPGSTYYIEAGVVHRATVLERPCVTIVETVERSKNILTYGNQGEPPFIRRSCNAVEMEQIKKCLEDIFAST